MKGKDQKKLGYSSEMHLIRNVPAAWCRESTAGARAHRGPAVPCALPAFQPGGHAWACHPPLQHSLLTSEACVGLARMPCYMPAALIVYRRDEKVTGQVGMSTGEVDG